MVYFEQNIILVLVHWHLEEFAAHVQFEAVVYMHSLNLTDTCTQVPIYDCPVYMCTFLCELHEFMKKL